MLKRIFDIETINRLYDKTLRLAQKEIASLRVTDTLLAATVVFVLLLVICTILASMTKKRLPWNSRIGYALAGAYSIFIVELAIFSREADSRDGIFNNSMFSPALTETEKIYIFLNVLFLIPFAIALAEGMYHQFGFIHTVLLVTWITFLLSLFVETTQRFTGRGYFELADLEANTLGGFIGTLIGAGIGTAFHKGHRKKVKKAFRKNK